MDTKTVASTATPVNSEIIMNTADLSPHPLNVTLYGSRSRETDELKELRDSVGTLGVLEPIVISRYELGGETANWILSGHRRWQAAKDCRLEHVPVRAVHLDGLEAERFLIEANRQRIKTKEQLTREYSALKRIETELAKQRQGHRSDIQANLPESSKGQARDKAAQAVGFKPKTAEKMEKIVKKADSGDAAARKALDDVNTGKKSVDRAHVEVIEPPRTKDKPRRVVTATPRVIDVPVKQVPSEVFSVEEASRRCLAWIDTLLKSVADDDVPKLYNDLISKLGSERDFFLDRKAKQAACPHSDRVPIKGKEGRYHCDTCGANFDAPKTATASA
jgi:ParB-like chromosome segregation protein Spo0J